MSGDTRFDTFGLLKPDCVELNTAKPEIYTRQYREAASITEYFERTPVQILADDVGTGKTWVAMMVLFARLNEGFEDQTRIKTRHALVVAPSRLVAGKWERELYRFNRFFVAEPETTAIDRLTSMQDLLDIVSESNSMDTGSKIEEIFKLKSRRQNNAAPILILHILETYKALLSSDQRSDQFGVGTEAELSPTTSVSSKSNGEYIDKQILNEHFRRFKDRYQKRDDSHTRRFLNAALPQRKVAKIIRLLRSYANACSKLRDDWFQHDFDALAWNRTANRNMCQWPTFRRSLIEIFNLKEDKKYESDQESTVADLNGQKLLKRMNHLVQIISVLWNEGERSNKIPKYAILDEDTENLLRDKFSADGDNPVLQTVLALLDQGLPPQAKDCIEQVCRTNNKGGAEPNFSFKKLWDRYDLKSDVLPDRKKTERIVYMLSAFADKVYALAGKRFSISNRVMARYAAAAVFESPDELHRTVLDVKQRNDWTALAQLLKPIFEFACSTKTRSAGALQYQRKGKLSRSESKFFDHPVQRLARTILQLIDYEVHPERVGSTFWMEKPKKRAIHVVYNNDLSVSKPRKARSVSQTGKTTAPDAVAETAQPVVDSNAHDADDRNNLASLRELERELRNKQPIEIAVIDEAHNWRNMAFGASSYREFVQPHVKRTLLVTATPLHMHIGDLKTIINLGHTCNLNSRKEKRFPEFRSGYEALFGADKAQDADPNNNRLLNKAKSFQKAVASSWINLQGNAAAVRAIEEAKNKLKRHTGDAPMRSAQLAVWERFKETGPMSLQKLAEAVTELVAFQEQKLLKPLRLLVIKTRAKKYVDESAPKPIGTRRYLCGREAGIEAVCNLDKPPADDAHLLLHNEPGVKQSGDSWVNLIGMRLSQLPLNESDQKQNARLMVGLPSSYAALKDSALLKDVRNRGSEQSDQRPEITRLYANVFEQCTANSEFSHPKVAKTAEIVFENLKRGRKTLIFCQRLATVKVLKNALDAKHKEFIGTAFGDLPAIEAKDSPSAVLERAFERATDAAHKLFGKSEVPLSPDKFDALKKYITSKSGERSIVASDYDARAVWLVSEIVNSMPDTRDSTKVKKLTLALLAVLYDEFESTAESESSSFSDQQDQSESAEISVAPWQDQSIRKNELEIFKVVTGETENKDSILANFSSPFYPLVLICSQVSQEGVDMHKFCRSIILHDLNWNPAVLEQRIGRLDRVGSFASELKQPVDVFVPFLADSYDEYQYRRVLQRAELQELLFGRNDKVLTDKRLTDDFDKHNDESADKAVPQLESLILGLFDMDLSPSSRRTDSGDAK